MVTRLARSYRPRGIRPSRKVGIRTVGVAVTLLLLVLLVAFVFEKAYAGKVPPGYRAGGVPLGGLSPDEASAKLNDMFDAKYGQVVLSADGRVFSATASDLGIRLDAASTLSIATAQPLGGSFIQRVLLDLQGLIYSREVPLVLVLDEQALRRYLTTVANSVDTDPVPAQVRYVNGAWQVVPSTTGKKLDIEAAMAAIHDALSQLAQGQVELPITRTEPPVTTEVAQQLARKAAMATAAPITLRAGDRRWTISPDDLAAHIVFIPGPPATLSLEKNWLTALLAQWAKEIEVPAREPVVAWQEDHIVVKDPGQVGVSLNIDAAVESILGAIDVGKNEVELPLTEVKPRVSPSEVSSLGIQELIATGRSYFRGSAPERAHNIKVASSFLNGILIAPGETFSFNQAIGDISTARGYREGYTIVADRTVRGVGGGVCQVSTTVFRAAFWAGLPILERNAHIYRVGWYEEGGDPVGLDAAIYQPGADLKFVNDTGHYILMQTSTDNGVLTVYLYGTKPARTVKMDGPYISNRQPAPEDLYEVDPDLPQGTKRQVEWAKEGMDVTVYRLIYQDGQPVRKDRFFSRYSPWPNMFKVSPDMAPSSQPTPTPTPIATPTATATPDH